MEKPESIAVAKGSIRRAIKEISWWKNVQEDVRKQLEFLINHIDQLGVSFCDAFRAACKLNERKRRLLKQNKSAEEPGMLFGMKLTEEEYQAAKDPAVCLLGLGEWVNLSEADVQACRLLCDHIEILISYKVLERENEPTIGEILSRTLLKDKSDDEDDDQKQEAPVDDDNKPPPFAEWKDDKTGLARFLGETLAKIPTFTDHMCAGFGQKLFERLRMCDRVDFLYDPDRHEHLDEDEFDKVVKFGYRNHIVFIEDIKGDFGGLSLMALRGLDGENQVYAIRLYADGTGCPPLLLANWLDVEPTFENVAGRSQMVVQDGLWGPPCAEDYRNVCDHDETFWNFVRNGHGKKLRIWEHSDGFMDLTTTRRIAKMVEWASNMLGFEA